MYYKIHKRSNGYILAVADKSVIGKTLKGQNKSDFFVNPRFYQDKEGTEKEIIDLLRDCSSANLIGEECVGIAIRNGFVDETNMVEIQKVPHAQIVVMN